MPLPSTPTNSGSSLPFSCYLDAEGNIWASAGPVIAFHATTAVFTIGGGGVGMVPTSTGHEMLPAAGSSASFKGGNGTNLEAEDGTPITGGTLVPYGRFRAVAENSYQAEGNPDFTLMWNAGDGSAELRDQTAAAVATIGAGAPIPRTGTFTATPYGEATYNGSAPWTIDITYEGAADPFPNRTAIVVVDDGASAQAGAYTRTGWQSWESADDPAWTKTLDGTGAGEWSDGIDVVATRAADANRKWDPTGEWVATPYGIANFGAPVNVTAGTVSAGTFPEQAWQLVTTEAGIEYHVGVNDPTKSIELDTATGDALLKDGTDVVGQRLGGSLVDIDGSFPATSYGEDTYNASAAWTYTVATAAQGTPFTARVALARGVPAAGVLYGKLTRDAVTDELTAAEGPFWGSLPPNTATEIYAPILESDGLGGVKQHQLGPIYWRPNP